jgi:hypothetical protein
VDVQQFLYKPAVGARGDDEKAKFDSGLDRVDSRLANEKWLNDSPYNGDLSTAVAAIGNAKTVLSIPAGNWLITANLTIPANLTVKFTHGALLTNLGVAARISGFSMSLIIAVKQHFKSFITPPYF